MTTNDSVEQYTCQGCQFWTANYEVTCWQDGSVEYLCDECFWYDPDDVLVDHGVRELNNGMRRFVGNACGVPLD